MKPRTGDGPMEVAKEGRNIIMRVPLEGGGRLVVSLNADEARDLGGQLSGVAVLKSPENVVRAAAEAAAAAAAVEEAAQKKAAAKKAAPKKAE